MERILVVEDDELIANLERDYLEAHGYEVTVALNGQDGMKYAMSGEYDTAILDVMLPGFSGFDICREIRKRYNIPIIMLTAKKEDVDKVRGLGLGADDYLVKPFSPSELIARVKAHLHIHNRLLSETTQKVEREESIQVGNLKILPKAYQVFKKSEEIFLTNREFELLLFLVENPNIVFSKDILFDRIWGMDSMGDTATVMVHVNRLRDKIEDDPSNPQFIKTVWGAGYRFHI